MLNLITAIIAPFAFDAHTRISALVSALLAVAVPYILYGERGSREFFEG